jgi:CoA:oxalate CoA-transferase
MGARVLKVERPGVGDESRRFGRHQAGGSSCYFASLNRNKRSIALDLKDPVDRDLFLELVGKADVLIHNWIQGSMDKLGFGWEPLQAINGRLIYCAISGYGPGTSFATRPAQDIIAQALSGFMSLTGHPDGPPLKSAIPVVDYVTGLYAASSISAALYERESSGRGQLVQLSLLHSALAMTSFASAAHLSCGAQPGRTGNRHPSICPYNLYRASDGWVVLAVANDPMWHRCCGALGLGALSDDPRFATNRDRLEHQDALEASLEQRFAASSSAELVDLLEAARVSCAQVNSVAEAFHSPPVAELAMVERCGDQGQVGFVGSAVGMSGIERPDTRPPPTLDQDADEIRRSRDW